MDFIRHRARRAIAQPIAQGAEPVEVYIWGQQPTSAATEQTRWARDLELRPSNTPSDVLQLTPGLLIGQHHGGGKADQILISRFRFRSRHRFRSFHRRHPGQHGEPRARPGIRRYALADSRNHRPGGNLQRALFCPSRRFRHVRRHEHHHQARRQKTVRSRSAAATTTRSATSAFLRRPKAPSCVPTSPARFTTTTGRSKTLITIFATTSSPNSVFCPRQIRI